jgi:CheY-like chemotaxis protein
VGTAEEHAGGHGTILLVEDLGEVRRVIAQGLRQNGYRVIEVADAAAARAFAGTAEFDRVDLVISDLSMPGETAINSWRTCACFVRSSAP